MLRFMGVWGLVRVAEDGGEEVVGWGKVIGEENRTVGGDELAECSGGNDCVHVAAFC